MQNQHLRCRMRAECMLEYDVRMHCVLQTYREQSNKTGGKPNSSLIAVATGEIAVRTNTTCHMRVNGEYNLNYDGWCNLSLFERVFSRLLLLILLVCDTKVLFHRARANKSIAGERAILIVATNHWLYWPWSFATIDWRVQCNQLIS